MQGVLGVALIVGTGFMVHFYAPQPSDDNLKGQVQQLHYQVEELKQEQAMPVMVLNRYRNSICYILASITSASRTSGPPCARISGTGFVVGDGLLATNRHVAEPWFGDPDSDALIQKGATPHLEKLLAYFPGFPTPLNVTPTVLSGRGDVAVLDVEDSPEVHNLRPLPLAEGPSNPRRTRRGRGISHGRSRYGGEISAPRFTTNSPTVMTMRVLRENWQRFR